MNRCTLYIFEIFWDGILLSNPGEFLVLDSKTSPIKWSASARYKYFGIDTMGFCRSNSPQQLRRNVGKGEMRHTEDKGKWIQPGPPLPFREIIKDGIYKRRIKAEGKWYIKTNITLA